MSPYRDPVRDTGEDGTAGTTAESAGEPRQYTGEPAADTGTEHGRQPDMAADGRTAEAGVPFPEKRAAWASRLV